MISELKPRYGAKTRIDVYVDGEYCLTAEKKVVAALGLKEGDAWDEQAFWDQAAASELDAALERSYTYLEGAMRSRRQLEEKMIRLGFAEPIRELVMERLEKLGFADDEAFARQWMQRRLNHNSVRAVSRELRQKGVDRDMIESIAQEETDEESEIEKCAAILKKYLSAPRLDAQTAKRRAISACQRRGYSWDQIRQALASVGEESEEWE